MHVVRHPVRQRERRRMYLPSERMVVSDVGLGDDLGFSFNIGKMFKRIVTITPTSFQPKKIFGAMASLTSTVLTGGLAPVLAPKIFSANSKTMQTTGMVMAAVGAAAGAVALLPAGTLTAAGSMLKSGGSGLMSMVSGIFGGKSQPQQQEYYGPPAPQQESYGPWPQQQEVVYGPGTPEVYGPGTPTNYQLQPPIYPTMPDMRQSGYGSYSPATDMRLQSPYSPLADDSLPIDPMTGQVMMPQELQVAQAGMLPQLSTTTWLMIGGATLAGWYLMSGEEKK